MGDPENRPKLGLVHGGQTSEYLDIGSGLLVDIAEIEGEDAEEVGTTNNYDELEFENENSNNGSDSINAFRVFGLMQCPECDLGSCTRPVKESCGHVKCRKCYISFETGCKQCERYEIENIETVGGTTREDQENYECGTSEEKSGNKKGFHIPIRSNEFVLELESSQADSGGKKYAVVSAETLKELGVDQSLFSNVDEEKICLVKIEPKEEILSDEDGGEAEDVGDTQTANGNEVEDVEDALHAANKGGVSAEDNRSAVGDENDNSQNEELPTIKTKRIKTVPKNMDHIIELKPSRGSDVNNKSKQMYKCNICRVKFHQKYRLNYHAFCNPVNGKRPFSCKICNVEFTSRSHSEYHVRAHTGEKPYECTLCSQRFIQKVKLTRHMKVHSTNKEYKPRSQVKPFVCGNCKKRFTTLGSLKRHLAVHTDNKPFECDICHKCFKTKPSLRAHKVVHIGDRQHKCKEQGCYMAFAAAKDLKRHLLCHTGEVPFECAVCTTKFRRKDNLERHIRKTHKLSEEVTKMMGIEAAKKYYGTGGRGRGGSGIGGSILPLDFMLESILL